MIQTLNGNKNEYKLKSIKPMSGGLLLSFLFFTAEVKTGKNSLSVSISSSSIPIFSKNLLKIAVAKSRND